ncbi:MAG: ABC transporter ATP-binding protein, partial [Desulfitobacterium hafniense]
GKTTTLRCVAGILQPNAGLIQIAGHDLMRKPEDAKRCLSFVPEVPNPYDMLTVMEHLRFVAAAFGAEESLSDAENLLKRLDLWEKRNALGAALSKGMKQKLGIIAALMLDAPVLILDEPSSGLDPLMQKIFIELILEEKKREKTIFMSSHHFPEIERTCERVGMIRDGELLAIQDITLLKQKERQTFDIEVSGEEDAELLRQSGLTLYPLDHHKFTIQVTGEQELLWKTLAQIRVRRFQQGSLELEEAFMHYYHSSLRGDNT